MVGSERFVMSAPLVLAGPIGTAAQGWRASTTTGRGER